LQNFIRRQAGGVAGIVTVIVEPAGTGVNRLSLGRSNPNPACESGMEISLLTRLLSIRLSANGGKKSLCRICSSIRRSSNPDKALPVLFQTPGQLSDKNFKSYLEP
jgi:hypothetical protein